MLSKQFNSYKTVSACVLTSAFISLSPTTLVAAQLEVTTNKSFETRNWMTDVDSDQPLNSLVLPGSHDAGMSELHHCDIGSKMNKGMV